MLSPLNQEEFHPTGDPQVLPRIMFEIYSSLSRGLPNTVSEEYTAYTQNQTLKKTLSASQPPHKTQSPPSVDKKNLSNPKGL